MEQLPLLLNLLVGVLWLGIFVDLLRRPPRIPAGWGVGLRRAVWGVVSVLALAAGGWGPQAWQSVTTTVPGDLGAGQPARSVSGMVRTPFAVVERTAAIDGEGRTIRNQRTTTLQIPLALLAFLAGAGWLQWRGRRSPAPGQGAIRGSTLVAGLVWSAATMAGACGGGGPDMADGDRPERRMVDVTWDTLARLTTTLDDSLLFSAGRPVPDTDGFWIPDAYGSRVARFDWEGRLVRHIGQRGGGPGELASFHSIDVDDSGTLWILDVPNNRISGFDTDGELVDEISLRDLEWRPNAFAVTGDGQSFLLMETSRELVPLILGRDGTAASGPPIPVPDAGGAWGMALQGIVTRERGGDGWIYAFSSGDGYFRLVGADIAGPRVPYPEPVPFPDIIQSVSREGSVTSTTTHLTNRTAAAASIWALDGELHVVFEGETPYSGRLLDRFDLQAGRYVDTVLLPRRGYVALWEDRVIVAGNDPTPEVLILRRME